MKESIKEYLNFTRKERLGILILVVIILLVAVAPAFFEPVEIAEDSAALAELRAGVIMLERRQDNQQHQKNWAGVDPLTGGNANAPQRFASDTEYNPSEYSPSQYSASDYNQPDYSQPNYKQPDYTQSYNNHPANRQPESESFSPVHKMFYFDPNKLDPAGWQKLGVREKTALTIAKYLSKGGKFNKPEDLLKIYGLSDAEKNRLLPFVKISPGNSRKDHSKYDDYKYDHIKNENLKYGNPGNGTLNNGSVKLNHEAQEVSRGSTGFKPFPRKSLHEIDINLADTSEWKTLPGIGASLSSRIVRYREKLGGFHHPDQVAEVYGLQDSVFRRIRAYLKCNSSTRKIRVNEATPDMLEQHPYMKRQIARAIVDYRNQHGPYRQLEDLRNLVIMTPALFEKMAPYFAF